MISDKNKNQINVQYLVFSFLPVIIAICLQYLVVIGDILILFFANLVSDEKTISTRTTGTILTQQYNQPMNLAYITLMQYVFYIVVFGIWYYKAFIKKNKNDETTSIGKSIKLSLAKNFKSFTPVFMIIAGVGAQLMVDGALTLLRPVFTSAFAEYDKLVSNVTGAGASWVMLLAVFIFAPIGEEFLFRGLIQGYAKKSFIAPLAILLQAALFGVYHGNAVQGVYAFIMGAVLGLITHKFGSLIPGIILHIAVNISMLFVPAALYETTTKCIITTLVAGVIFVVLIILAIKLNEKELKNIDKEE